MQDETSGVGSRIRELRKLNGTTLQELSEFTGLSVGHLSQIERNLTSPTLANLDKIAESLGTTVTQLVSGPEHERNIIRKGSEEISEFPNINTTVGYYRFSNTPVILEDITIEPGKAADQQWSRHVFPEIAFVVEGELTLILEDAHMVLHQGDAAVVPQNRRHKILNEGTTTSHSVWVYLRRS
ncbi:MAG: helix-turn-helix domain-containing protein [Atopobiaceae bacterium]|jgi:transcriptional regulator with XRE-family HTH domain